MKIKNKYKILITVPYKKEGGVYSFCEAIIPAFNCKVDIFKRGSQNNKVTKSRIIKEHFIDYLKFIRSLIINKYDLVFINTSLGRITCIRDGILVLIAKLFKLKVLLFIHGFERKCLENKFLLKGYFFSDKIVVLAADFRDQLISAGFKREIFASYNPVNQNIINSIQAEDLERRKNRKPRNILFLSRVEEEKGIMIALKAFETLKEKYKNLNLFIAGTGSATNDAKNYVYSRKLKNVNFLGFVNGQTKIGLLKKSDIFLFPTTYKEGLPINVLEAMMIGLPIVTRPEGGIKDFFKNEEMGYLIESKDPEDFAGAIELLIKSENLYNISFYNFQFARHNFQPRQIAEKLENIISVIVNE